jgi:L-iditol 2-dehydrogenase
MKAAVFYAPNDLRLEERAIPHPRNGEIVVKVDVSGLCPSDVRIYKVGSSSVKAPVTLGHEFVGHVHELGPEVRDIEENDKVNVPADAYCGKCRMCQGGHENTCEDMLTFGYNLNGAHADYVLVPPRFVERGGIFPLSDEVDTEEATMIEPLACSLNTIESLGAGPGKTIVVIGDGPMGLLHVALARLYAAERIILIGLVDKKLQLGKELGATDLIDAKGDATKAVLEVTGGVGSDIVVITAVMPQTIAEALRMVSRHGYVSIFGGTPKGAKAEFEPNLIHYNEAFLTGNFGYTYATYSRAAKIVASHKIPLKRLISHRFKLEQIHDAIKTWDDKENSMKIMLTR